MPDQKLSPDSEGDSIEVWSVHRQEESELSPDQGTSTVFKKKYDEVAIEEPLEIRVNHRAVSVTMRTPGHDQELALGFLLSEGIIHHPGDWISAKHYPRNEFGNIIDVFLNPDLDIDFKQLTRHVFGSSSCGLCGKATLESVLNLVPVMAPEDGSLKPFDCDPNQEVQFSETQESSWVSPNALWKAAESVKSQQLTFHRTGGLHASAVLDSTGKLVVLREDVGRHNALDKVLGYGLINKLLPYKKRILWVSGRTSFEIMQKAWAGGVEVVAGVSAPSSLAVALARKTGQTLIGFLRSGRFNIYSGAWRILNWREQASSKNIPSSDI